MKAYLTILLLLPCMLAYGQTTVKTQKSNTIYRVNLTITPKLYLNGINVQNDGIAPEAIRTKNTGGYTFGAEIERKGKTGFLLNAGLHYGVRGHNITMGYEDMSFFEPSIAEELNQFGPQIETYTSASSYVKLRLMAGYVVPLKLLHGCNLEIKAGISASAYMTDFTAEFNRGIQLIKNDTLYITKVGYGYAHFGSRYRFQYWVKTAEGYIGLKKELNTKYLKHISVGLEFTKAIFNISDAYVDSYSLYTGIAPISTDKYLSKDLSIGLRLSAGLWYK